MAEIRAFRGYRYNLEQVAAPDVLTQPYDKITPAMQQHYYAASPYNLIPIEKGRSLPEDTADNNVYTRAAAKLKEWIAAGILVKDAAPAIYAYAQECLVPGTNTRRTRRGFIGLGRVEDYEAGVVFRHEQTLAAPKADRLELLRQTHAQTGLLFMLYDDASKQIDAMLEAIGRTNPAVELKDEYGVTHRLWPVPDESSIEEIRRAMAAQKLVIADGHHRYETALAYRNECRSRDAAKNPDAPYEFAMMALFNAHGSGLTILPTHRLIHNIANFDFQRFRLQAAKFFDWYAYPFSSDEERQTSLAEFTHELERQRSRHAIGIYAGGNAFYLFVLRRGLDLEQLLPKFTAAQRQLDVILLHKLLIERCLNITAEAVEAEKHISYVRDVNESLAEVDRGNAQMACVLNAVRVQEVLQIALAGEVMPQKSTDFYPKLLSGLVIYKLDESAE
jgi:uncharacterized protein (DUF1015 family)